MSSPKILKIYKQICKTAWWSYNDAGVISKIVDPANPDKTQALLVEDNSDHNKNKVLVLPQDNNLVNLDTSKYLVMHPLAENITKGESPIVARIRRAMMIRLNWVLSEVITQLLVFAASPAKHDKLSPEQLDMMKIMSTADEVTIQTAEKLHIAAKTKYKFWSMFVSVYLAKGATINGKTFKRGAIAKFPLYEELVNSKGTEVLGVKNIRKKDKELFIKMFEKIIPGIANPETYSVGSNTNVAPYMDSLMRCMAGLFAVSNDLVSMYSNVYNNADLLEVPTEWSEDFIDIEALGMAIRHIPPQRGNDADVKVSEQKQASIAADMGNFQSTALKDATGQSIESKTVSMDSIGAKPNTAVTTAPWEPLPAQAPIVAQPVAQPVVQQTNTGSNGRISFDSLAIAQRPAMQQFVPQQQLQQMRPAMLGNPMHNQMLGMQQNMMQNPFMMGMQQPFGMVNPNKPFGF